MKCLKKFFRLKENDVEGNLDLHEEMDSTGNVKYMG